MGKINKDVGEGIGCILIAIAIAILIIAIGWANAGFPGLF